MLRIVMFEIPTSLNQFPSADENDVDDDTSDNDGSEHDDGHCIDNVSKHGYVKRRNVLNPERCKYACDYFKAAANSRDGRHIITNGHRRMLTVDPSRTKDVGMLQIIEDVKLFPHYAPFYSVHPLIIPSLSSLYYIIV